MAYDAKKDKLIKDLGPVEGTEMTAELRQYDGGEVKVAFLKHFVKKDESKGSRRAISVPLSLAGPVGKLLAKLGDSPEDFVVGDKAVPEEVETF